jgi:hypothetical protein
MINKNLTPSTLKQTKKQETYAQRENVKEWFMPTRFTAEYIYGTDNTRVLLNNIRISPRSYGAQAFIRSHVWVRIDKKIHAKLVDKSTIEFMATPYTYDDNKIGLFHLTDFYVVTYTSITK